MRLIHAASFSPKGVATISRRYPSQLLLLLADARVGLLDSRVDRKCFAEVETQLRVYGKRVERVNMWLSVMLGDREVEIDMTSGLEKSNGGR